MIAQVIKKVFSRIWTHGWIDTLVLIFKNIRVYIHYSLDKQFDNKFRVNTAGRINLESLSIESDNKIQGVYYEPTPQKTFHHILSHLNIDYQEFEFIDFGCGKGRALFLAARYPFRKIIGVEFSFELVDLARCNLASFTDKHQQCKNLEVLCMDAVKYKIPDSKAILYFYNPFSASIMEVIALNLRESFMRNRIKKFVIYYYPQSIQVFQKLSFLRKIASVNKVVDFASPLFRGYAIFETIDDWIEPK